MEPGTLQARIVAAAKAVTTFDGSAQAVKGLVSCVHALAAAWSETNKPCTLQQLWQTCAAVVHKLTSAVSSSSAAHFVEECQQACKLLLDMQQQAGAPPFSVELQRYALARKMLSAQHVEAAAECAGQAYRQLQLLLGGSLLLGELPVPSTAQQQPQLTQLVLGTAMLLVLISASGVEVHVDPGSCPAPVLDTAVRAVLACIPWLWQLDATQQKVQGQALLQSLAKLEAAKTGAATVVAAQFCMAFVAAALHNTQVSQQVLRNVLTMADNDNIPTITGQIAEWTSRTLQGTQSAAVATASGFCEAALSVLATLSGSMPHMRYVTSLVATVLHHLQQHQPISLFARGHVLLHLVAADGQSGAPSDIMVPRFWTEDVFKSTGVEDDSSALRLAAVALTLSRKAWAAKLQECAARPAALPAPQAASAMTALFMSHRLLTTTPALQQEKVAESVAAAVAVAVQLLAALHPKDVPEEVLAQLPEALAALSSTADVCSRVELLPLSKVQVQLKSSTLRWLSSCLHNSGVKLHRDGRMEAVAVLLAAWQASCGAVVAAQEDEQAKEGTANLLKRLLAVTQALSEHLKRTLPKNLPRTLAGCKQLQLVCLCTAAALEAAGQLTEAHVATIGMHLARVRLLVAEALSCGNHEAAAVPSAVLKDRKGNRRKAAVAHPDSTSMMTDQVGSGHMPTLAGLAAQLGLLQQCQQAVVYRLIQHETTSMCKMLEQVGTDGRKLLQALCAHNIDAVTCWAEETGLAVWKANSSMLVLRVTAALGNWQPAVSLSTGNAADVTQELPRLLQKAQDSLRAALQDLTESAPLGQVEPGAQHCRASWDLALVCTMSAVQHRADALAQGTAQGCGSAEPSPPPQLTEAVSSAVAAWTEAASQLELASRGGMLEHLGLLVDASLIEGLVKLMDLLHLCACHGMAVEYGSLSQSLVTLLTYVHMPPPAHMPAQLLEALALMPAEGCHAHQGQQHASNRQTPFQFCSQSVGWQHGLASHPGALYPLENRPIMLACAVEGWQKCLPAHLAWLHEQLPGQSPCNPNDDCEQDTLHERASLVAVQQQYSDWMQRSHKVATCGLGGIASNLARAAMLQQAASVAASAGHVVDAAVAASEALRLLTQLHAQSSTVTAVSSTATEAVHLLSAANFSTTTPAAGQHATAASTADATQCQGSNAPAADFQQSLPQKGAVRPLLPCRVMWLYGRSLLQCAELYESLECVEESAALLQEGKKLGDMLGSEVQQRLQWLEVLMLAKRQQGAQAEQLLQPLRACKRFSLLQGHLRIARGDYVEALEAYALAVEAAGYSTSHVDAASSSARTRNHPERKAHGTAAAQQLAGICPEAGEDYWQALLGLATCNAQIGRVQEALRTAHHISQCCPYLPHRAEAAALHATLLLQSTSAAANGAARPVSCRAAALVGLSQQHANDQWDAILCLKQSHHLQQTLGGSAHQAASSAGVALSSSGDCSSGSTSSRDAASDGDSSEDMYGAAAPRRRRPLQALHQANEGCGRGRDRALRGVQGPKGAGKAATGPQGVIGNTAVGRGRGRSRAVRRVTKGGETREVLDMEVEDVCPGNKTQQACSSNGQRGKPAIRDQACAQEAESKAGDVPQLASPDSCAADTSLQESLMQLLHMLKCCAQHPGAVRSVLEAIVLLCHHLNLPHMAFLAALAAVGNVQQLQTAFWCVSRAWEQHRQVYKRNGANAAAAEGQAVWEKLHPQLHALQPELFSVQYWSSSWEVSSGLQRRGAPLVPESFAELEASAVVQLQQACAQLPESAVLACLGVLRTGSFLLIGRYHRQQQVPLLLVRKLPTSLVAQQPLGAVQFQLSSLLEDSHGSMAGVAALRTMREKQQWWQIRIALDARMQQLQQQLQDDALGPYRMLLSTNTCTSTATSTSHLVEQVLHCLVGPSGPASSHHLVANGKPPQPSKAKPVHMPCNSTVPAGSDAMQIGWQAWLQLLLVHAEQLGEQGVLQVLHALLVASGLQAGSQQLQDCAELLLDQDIARQGLTVARNLSHRAFLAADPCVSLLAEANGVETGDSCAQSSGLQDSTSTATTSRTGPTTSSKRGPKPVAADVDVQETANAEATAAAPQRAIRHRRAAVAAAAAVPTESTGAGTKRGVRARAEHMDAKGKQAEVTQAEATTSSTAAPQRRSRMSAMKAAIALDASPSHGNEAAAEAAHAAAEQLACLTLIDKHIGAAATGQVDSAHSAQRTAAESKSGKAAAIGELGGGAECRLAKDGSAVTAVEEGAIVLALGGTLHPLPWEGLPCMQGKRVYRVFSLHCALAAAAQLLPPAQCVLDGHSPVHDTALQAGPGGTAPVPVLDSADTFFLLNPGGDLKDTQNVFQNCFASWGWQGFTGSAAPATQLLQELQQHRMFVYFGHGAGEAYLPGPLLRRLDSCPAALLMGCSSGKLQLHGHYPPTGTLTSYLLAGCPVAVANLWDVTDKDIDRFSQALLQQWVCSSVHGQSPDNHTAQIPGTSTGNMASSLAVGPSAGFTELSAGAGASLGQPAGTRRGKAAGRNVAAKVDKEQRRGRSSRLTARQLKQPKKGQGESAAEEAEHDTGAEDSVAVTAGVDVAASVAMSRKACKLPALIGSAPVCYGVPTVVIHNQA